MIVGLAAAIASGWCNGCRANLVVNGGFEDGVYSSTATPSPLPAVTNSGVPDGWTPSPGFDIPAWNGVTSSDPHSGSFALFIGNDPGFPLASLSQTFTTVPGEFYVASFYIANVYSAGYFNAFIDSNEELNIVGSTNIGPPPYTYSFTTTFANGQTLVSSVASPANYTLESFTFVGTGSDTLTFTGVTDDASFLIEDMSVDVPEPPGWYSFLIGCAAIGFTVVSRKGGRHLNGPAWR
jgi:hypothetical protein